ncbi:MAG TPA: glycosyltransferase family 4 protein [Vicinamibacterales bacterium]|nr:glycosyltransferase family 4 protein [Vicinamibacterales bacterium]
MQNDRVKVLALSPIPEEGAGCRFRISQYVPHLREQGFDVDIKPFYTTSFFRTVYNRGRFVRKGIAFAGLVARRARLLGELDKYQLVFLYREAIPAGPPWIEQAIARRGIPIVLDFDDAIFLPSVSEANRPLAFLKDSRRADKVMALSTQIIVGNNYLADYARRLNPAVTVVPTAVDTTRFVPRAAREPNGSRPLVVGWIGSPTTYHYLEAMHGLLSDVATRLPFTLKVSGGGKPVRFEGVRTIDVPWSLQHEVELFNTCDVGIYPLSDDDWSRGKCGFKAIQFMACGVPVVAAAVGVNREIIRDGENGFLATTPDEWRSKLERLLTDAPLRARFAAAGRQTIEDRYSLRVTAPAVAHVMRKALVTTR